MEGGSAMCLPPPPPPPPSIDIVIFFVYIIIIDSLSSFDQAWILVLKYETHLIQQIWAQHPLVPLSVQTLDPPKKCVCVWTSPASQYGSHGCNGIRKYYIAWTKQYTL